MTRWHRLEPCDATFFESAPHVYRFPMELPVPVERVWESLASDQSIGAWSPLVRSVRWTSPRPFGPGTTRVVALPLGAVTVREQFFRWDEGQRQSFYVTDADRPVLTRFAEDYLLEPTSAGCRLTWTFALEGTARTRHLLAATSVGNALVLRQLAHGSTSYFARGGDSGAG